MHIRGWGISVVGAFSLLAQPTFAQEADAAESIVSIEALLSQSRDISSAMALAQQQAASGDYVGAAATFERIQLAYGNNDDVRLSHAIVLCHLDDPSGAKAELENLEDGAVIERRWGEVTAACGALERPDISEVG